MILNQLFTIMASLLILIIAFVYLKPFRFHKTLKFSTLVFKISYLVYLIALFVLFYMSMFYRNKSLLNTDYLPACGYCYFIIVLIVVGMIIPTLGVAIRRKIKRRERYNYFLIFINFLYIFFFMMMILFSNWGGKIVYVE